MSVNLIVTSQPPDGPGGRAEKIRYRCNQLLKNGMSPIVLIPGFSLSKEMIDIEEGTVIHYGHKNKIDESNESIESSSNEFKNATARGINWIKKLADEALFPDSHIIYLPTTVRNINNLMHEYDIEHLNTHSFPFSYHLMGLIVKKYHPSLNWVVELRDPWGNNKKQLSGVSQMANKYLEKVCIQAADNVVYYGDTQIPKGYFEDTYPNLVSKFIRCDVFGYNERTVYNIPPQEFNTFTICYAGNIYEDTDLSYFFKAVSLLCDEYNLGPNELKLVFVGDKLDQTDYSNLIGELGINEYIKSIGLRPHEEAMSIIKGSDVALYASRLLPLDELNVSTKMYDYVGAGTPILCLSRPGWKSWKFVEENQVGEVSDIENTEDIYKNLCIFYESEPYRIDKNSARKFERKIQFEKILTSIKA